MSSPATNELTRHYERIIAHADRDETTGCLVSRYSVGSHGYAQAWSGFVTLAHLVVWRYVNGPIPEGMTVDHEECRNRRCIEITHLRLLPNLENARRNAPGRDWPLGTCRNGHGPELWRPKGPNCLKGYCHACRMDIQRRRRAAAKLAIQIELEGAQHPPTRTPSELELPCASW